MANITDYLKWRGDLTFKESPLNEVDNLILSELVYIEISKKDAEKKTTIKEAINKFLKKYDEKQMAKKFALSKNPYSFLEALANSKRFGNLYITNYVNKVSKKEEKQFSAMVIHINFHTIYISFKGTDETLVGWKEDLNMGFMNEIPSQLEAVHYVNKVVSFKDRHIYLGGHSKGGNLAVYAGVKCKKRIQKRIQLIFNNDGPGFTEDFVNKEDYLNTLPKIKTYLPETSIIGMLLTQKSEYQVIKSDSIGIWQHDTLTWQVEGTKFVTLKEVDETSSKLRITITSWLEKVDKKEREVFINTLYQILEKSHIETVEELTKLKLRTIPNLLRNFTKLEEETRKIMIATLKELMKEANKNFDRKTILHGLRTISKKRS